MSIAGGLLLMGVIVFVVVYCVIRKRRRDGVDFEESIPMSASPDDSGYAMHRF